MKVTMLGQAGLLFTLTDGRTVIVDPYLSDSIFITKGERFRRLVPVNEDFFNMDPDVFIPTHNHGDHMDIVTLDRWLAWDRDYTVLGPLSVFNALYLRYPGRHNFVILSEGVETTQYGVTFQAIPAAHEDIYAVGVYFEADYICVYLTGDMLYTNKIPAAVPPNIHCMFPCINGWATT
jgi:L-ascorbate metabolism protein UlaG (beta-lactamase superfamily)